MLVNAAQGTNRQIDFLGLFSNGLKVWRRNWVNHIFTATTEVDQRLCYCIVWGMENLIEIVKRKYYQNGNHVKKT